MVARPQYLAFVSLMKCVVSFIFQRFSKKPSLCLNHGNPELQMFITTVCTQLTDHSFFVFSEQIKVSVNDFIIKAAAVTLKVSIVKIPNSSS